MSGRERGKEVGSGGEGEWQGEGDGGRERRFQGEEGVDGKNCYSVYVGCMVLQTNHILVI